MSQSQKPFENHTTNASQARFENHSQRASSNLVSLTDIIFDEEIYPRIQPNFRRIYQYQKAMEAGRIFPPILLGQYKSKLYLIDGKHRVEATQKLNQTYITATIKPYKSKLEMFKEAIELNMQGLDLTWSDKTKIFNKLRAYKTEDKEISLLLGVPVNNFDVFIDRVVTRDGKTVIIPSSFMEPLRNNQISEAQIIANYKPVEHRKIVSRTASHAIEQMVTLLKNDVINFEDDAIREKCVEIVNLIQLKLGVTA